MVHQRTMRNKKKVKIFIHAHKKTTKNLRQIILPFLKLLDVPISLLLFRRV